MAYPNPVCRLFGSSIESIAATNLRKCYLRVTCVNHTAAPNRLVVLSLTQYTSALAILGRSDYYVAKSRHIPAAIGKI